MKCDTGPKTRRLLFLAFYWIIFYNESASKYLFQYRISKYLVSNWSYTRLIRTIKKGQKSDKKCKTFRVIIMVHNRYFIILKLFRGINGFILYQIKQTTLKTDYKFITYGKFTNTSWIEVLQTRNPSLLFWTSSSISRKRQATGLEPLRHKW